MRTDFFKVSFRMIRDLIFSIIQYCASKSPVLNNLIHFRGVKQNLRITFAKGARDHNKVVELASKSLHRPMLPDACLSIVESANQIGQYNFSKALLQKTAKDTDANALVLSGLSKEYLFTGDFDKALTYASQALMASPDSHEAVLAYLAAKDAKNIELNDEELTILNTHKNHLPVVRAVCKRCKNKSTFKKIYKALLVKEGLPDAYINALSDAACRVKEFDVARKHLIESLTQAVKNPQSREIEQIKTTNGRTNALLDIARILGQPSIPFFAATNTALELSLKGALLENNKKIIFGIIEEHWNSQEITNIIKNNTLFTPPKVNLKHTKISFQHRNGIEVNLLCFYRDKKKIYHDGDFVRWWNTHFELEPVDIEGNRIYKPVGEKYLEENYGDWQASNLSFDASLNGSNKQIISKEHYSAYIIKASNIALRNKSTQKAITLMKDGVNGNHLSSNEKKIFRSLIEILEEQKNA